MEEVRIIKVEVEDNMSINADGELMNEPVVHIYIVPKTETKHVMCNITILPTGGISGIK